MTDSATRRLSVESLAAFLVANGWSRHDPGRLGWLFERGSAAVAVPEDFHGDLELAKTVAARIADAMDLTLSDVLDQLQAVPSDQVEFRLVGESLSDGDIPLGAAWETLRNARRLFASSGTSVASPVRSINKNYYTDAQRVSREARLAHTRAGSFVFPFRVLLGDGSEQLFPAGSVAIEPFERKLTRTLAQGISAALELIGEPIEQIPDRVLDGAAALGVSRELCLSLSDLLKHDSISHVDVSFDWSSRYQHTGQLPTALRVDRSTRPQFRKLARRLAVPTVIDNQRFPGVVVEVGNDPDEREFFFVLDTYSRSKRTTLRVTITPDQRERAIGWYRDHSTVVVVGPSVEGVSGLRMDRPVAIEAFVTDQITWNATPPSDV